ncbi:hypothetical protein F5Y18DRAFT_248815 [Xylariaceae sp. FL1019]|nr:hypothetical protein F5Y18DRAFT_248815 [Xylariaceae sp. FL1019]
MATTAEPTTGPPPMIPDYMKDPNAVLKDADAQWRYKNPPDYKKTRKYFEETKSCNHAAGSLEEMVENLVKNWEIEASYKTRLNDWRTVDLSQYTFANNGQTPHSAEHMLRLGTYNAMLTPSSYYDPNGMDFGTSHKVFKRMMPTFAWEVIEVYTGPPSVSFKWRHWGRFEKDYTAVNNANERVEVKATGQLIDLTGITVATLDDRMRITKLKTWFGPEEMWKQIDPENKATRVPMTSCPMANIGGAGPNAPDLNVA